jgi:hypothetical protein
MRLEWFLRRRTVYLPTLAGWAVLALVAAGTAATLARAAAPFLAVDEPVGRGLLVVEGWIPRRALREAAEAFRRGGYAALVVTGGPILDPECREEHRTYAEGAAAFLETLGLGGRELVVVPAPDAWDARTLESARALRRWIDATRLTVDAVDVFSYGPHTRRSRDAFRLALGRGVVVGSRAAAPEEYDLRRWWRTGVGVRTVLGEAVAYGSATVGVSLGDGR